MEFHTEFNVAQFSTYVFDLTANLSEWRLIEAACRDSNGTNIGFAGHTLMKMFHKKEGKIIIDGEYSLLCLVRVGAHVDEQKLVSDMMNFFPKRDIQFKCRKVDDEVLEALGVQIEHLDSKRRFSKEGYMHGLRSKRHENVALLADDDPLIRTLLQTTLEPLARICESKDGVNALDLYMENMPDIVFLDIHMPGRSGVNILGDILRHDPDAFVVMLSADSSKEKVIGTHRIGSKGFIRKPFTREKIEVAVKKCPTFN